MHISNLIWTSTSLFQPLKTFMMSLCSTARRDLWGHRRKKVPRGVSEERDP